MLGLIGAGLGLASSIFGGIKSAQAAKRQQKLIDDARDRNEIFFNKEYYQDYMDRSDTQAAMKRVRDYMKKSNERTENAAVVSGATPEAVVAQKEANADVISDTASAIQANADAHKDRALERYQSQESALDNAEINQEQMTEAGMANLASQGLQTAISSAQSIDLDSLKPKAELSTAAKQIPESKAKMDNLISNLKKKTNYTSYPSVWDN